MNRDSTVIQAAILLIIIAVLGVAIIKKQQQQTELMPTDPMVTITTQNQQDELPETDAPDTEDVLADTGTVTTTGSDTVTGQTEQEENQPLVEQPDSPYTNIVQQYFNAVEQEDYVAACDYLSPAKCNSANPAIVENFQREYEKFVDGYEYVNIKDYGIVAPSGKHVVCVKYTYTYEQDTNPAPTSEILSFYLDEVNDRLQITDRVCEKKYKDGWGVRPCPVLAATDFCEGNIK